MGSIFDNYGGGRADEIEAVILSYEINRFIYLTQHQPVNPASNGTYPEFSIHKIEFLATIFPSPSLPSLVPLKVQQ